MHEFVENLVGVEVIADDFVIAGFRDTEVLRSLNANERAFFERCRIWNLKLNPQKVKRCQTSGPSAHPRGIDARPRKDQGDSGDVGAKGRHHHRFEDIVGHDKNTCPNSCPFCRI